MPARNIVFGEIEDAHLVIVPGLWTEAVVYDDHADWLALYGNGAFKRRPLPALDDDQGETLYEFSCPDTAFAFKLRFG